MYFEQRITVAITIMCLRLWVFVLAQVQNCYCPNKKGTARLFLINEMTVITYQLSKYHQEEVLSLEFVAIFGVCIPILPIEKCMFNLCEKALEYTFVVSLSAWLQMLSIWPQLFKLWMALYLMENSIGWWQLSNGWWFINWIALTNLWTIQAWS